MADAQIRYSQDSLDHLCALLDLHEVVEPRDYVDPLPWWGGLEAERMLLRRGIGPFSEDGVTFGSRPIIRCAESSHTVPKFFPRRIFSSGEFRLGVLGLCAFVLAVHGRIGAAPSRTLDQCLLGAAARNDRHARAGSDSNAGRRRAQ